jgi:hypothetical protein
MLIFDLVADVIASALSSLFPWRRRAGVPRESRAMRQSRKRMEDWHRDGK